MLKTIMTAATVSALALTSALAQSTTTPPAAPAPSTQATPATPSAGEHASFVARQTPDQWLASKFRGTDVIGANEEKIGDVSDILFDKDGTTQLASTTSDADGHYEFDDLAAGVYVAQYDQPAGERFSPPLEGGSAPDPLTGRMTVPLYQDILDAELKRQALLHFESPRHTVASVAAALGYQDVSAFRRAFKRWAGQTPQAYLAARKG